MRRTGDVWRGAPGCALTTTARVVAERPELVLRMANRLVLVAGSGIEEAALVVRDDLAEDRVRRVAVPQEGGIKDLTTVGSTITAASAPSSTSPLIRVPRR